MSSMTLEQVRDWIRNCAVSSTESSDISNEFLGEMADAIDAHIAGMGEPVAQVVAQDVKSHGYPRAIEHLLPVSSVDELLPVGTKLYTAPPIDLAAVREVISELREQPFIDMDYERRVVLADKLEAAIKGAA